MTFRFVDFFAGIGGFRLAAEGLFNCAYAVEYDESCRKTYLANFSQRPAGNIRGIPLDAVPEHDLFVAGFPCQPFSIAGVSKKNSLGREHGFKDKDQGTLFFEILRVLKYRAPRAFLLENVKNLKSHDRGRTLQTIKTSLESLGYNIRLTLMDAACYVPQARQRVYIAGFKDGAVLDDYSDLFADAVQSRIGFQPPHLIDILDDTVDDKYTLTSRLYNGLVEHKKRHGDKGNGFGFSLANLAGASRTLSARYHKDGQEILIPPFERVEGGFKVLEGLPRRLTPRECARLMGFPDDFQIVAKDTPAYKQFGNSVVVPAVRVHISAIHGAFLRVLEA